MGTPHVLSIFTKGNSFYDFQFASPIMNPPEKELTFKGKNLLLK